MAISDPELAAIVKGLAPAVRDFTTRAVGDSEARVLALEQRLAQLETKCQALEQKACIRFAGTWTSDRTYQKGDAVVRGWSLWICVGDRPGEPGRAPGWQLAIKKGAAG